MVNNHDWFKNIHFLDFIRETGKHITVNYMMSKDSVKNRLSGDGMSFTEFTYQLIQGYDFLHLYQNEGCKIQMGGSDQWGNILTGSELIRRKIQGEAFAITAPLIKKADGTKFGKSEGGNIWLDSKRTSPYRFYQFWLNTADADAVNFIKIFTLLDKHTISEIITAHQETPHHRLIQKRLAEELTRMIHSQKELQLAIDASQILFNKASSDILKKLSEVDLLSIFEGVPQGHLDHYLNKNITDVLVESGFLKSKSDARRSLKENAISVNQEKVSEDFVLSKQLLINDKYILLQRGKKNYFLLSVS